MTDEHHRAAIADLVSWARSRIDWCRCEEAKFSPSSDASLAASTERRSLQSVLRILGYEAAREPGQEEGS